MNRTDRTDSFNTSVNFFGSVTPDGQTDRKPCIRAHCAFISTGVLKKWPPPPKYGKNKWPSPANTLKNNDPPPVPPVPWFVPVDRVSHSINFICPWVAIYHGYTVENIFTMFCTNYTCAGGAKIQKKSDPSPSNKLEKSDPPPLNTLKNNDPPS